MNNFKKYLPSKNFIATVLFFVIIIAVFFVGKGIISLIKSKMQSKNAPTKMLVGNIIQKDSNNNGIPDWEEYLWGFDPMKNGEANKNAITAKKNELALKVGSNIAGDSKDADDLSQSESLSRQVFALIVSLQQSGGLDASSIQSISDTVGEQITATPIADKYTEEMATVVKSTAESLEKYKNDLGDLMIEYMDKDMGNELIFIAEAIKSNDQTALYAAKTVAISYKEVAQKLMGLSVPTPQVEAHLKLANDYDKTGQSIEGMSLLISDPIVGMKSLINYKNYSEALVLDIEAL
jgi:hypothetical protein